MNLSLKLNRPYNEKEFFNIYKDTITQKQQTHFTMVVNSHKRKQKSTRKPS